MNSEFWNDFEENLKDPAFVRDYIRESIRITTIDAIINRLDEARLAEGLSKTDLARAIGAQPSVVRRLFSAADRNPTLGTLAEIAAALGMRLRLEPMDSAHREAMTEALRTGRATEATRRLLVQTGC